MLYRFHSPWACMVTGSKKNGIDMEARNAPPPSVTCADLLGLTPTTSCDGNWTLCVPRLKGCFR